MDLERLTQKSQEAVLAAQSLAVRHGHPEVDAEHLALALLEQEDGLLPRLLERLQVPVPELASALARELDRRPRVSGPGAEPGKILVTQRFQRLFAKAEDEATARRTRRARTGGRNAAPSTRSRGESRSPGVRFPAPTG